MANSVRFGPGTFTLGSGTPVVYDCQVQSMGINVNKNTGDDITVLCGDQVLGSITYDYALAGTVLQDFGVADGLIQYSWEHSGETVAFSFTPSTSSTATVTGEIVMDPLPFGDSGAAFGDLLTADFEWSIQGKPDFTWPAVVPLAANGTTTNGTTASKPLATTAS